MNEQKLVVLVGVSGSGKSTYARTLKEKDFIVISTDEIRGELWGDENDQREPHKVFQEAHRRIRKFLKMGYSVVFDATNLSARRRESFLKEFKHFSVQKECVVFITPPQTIKERMEERERKVPYEVIEKQICSFQCPLYYEGWDTIEIKWDFECFKEKTNRYHELCEKTDNDNHHHSTKTVMDHIDEAVMYFAIEYSKRKDFNVAAVAEALKHHDIGKPQTKVFFDSKGHPTKEAHYYGHQNYSAYIYLMINALLYITDEKKDELLTVANLIQFHMEHFFRDSRNLKKFYKKTGLEKELEIIAECDVAGH